MLFGLVAPASGRLAVRVTALPRSVFVQALGAGETFLTLVWPGHEAEPATWKRVYRVCSPHNISMLYGSI
jgi:hypothetical protein